MEWFFILLTVGMTICFVGLIATGMSDDPIGSR